jgi:5-deoxy-glucuronate isomerase
VGETLNPPGGWSSWPPHAHAHEEIYLYRFDPEHGFGVHVDVGDDACAIDGDAPQVVRDGDIVRITSGHHPVVAAPGCTMYYLWALAGDAPSVDTRMDTRFTS